MLQADGSSLGYAPLALFSSEEADSNPKAVTTEGVYGQADDGQHNRPEGADICPFKYYDVKVKKDCAEDDPEEDRYVVCCCLS